MPLRLLLPFLLVAPTFAADTPAVLPGTEPLELERPLWEEMIDGLDRFCLAEIEKSVERRERHWKRDYSSPEAYEKSVEPNRERLREYLGAVDERVTDLRMEATSEGVGDSDGLKFVHVRWHVLDGVTGEGLVIAPERDADHRARVVAVPDAGWSPNQFAGLADGLSPRLQLARRMARSGCMVLVPRLIDREDEFSGDRRVGFTNQPHREWIYRPAFQMGRHVVGYEVQKTIAAIDVLRMIGGRRGADLPVGVLGVGEGGMIGMHAAALDPGIDASLVSGYFGPRENVWAEPVYRNVWRLLDEFGDAEVASLIAPRTLIVEAARAPEVDGPPAARDGRRGEAAPGVIRTPKIADVRREFERAKVHFDRIGRPATARLVESGETGDESPGTDEALQAFLHALDADAKLAPVPRDRLSERGVEADRIDENQRRQVDELITHVQRLMENSDRRRYEFWKNPDRGRSKSMTPDEWEAFAEPYRDHVYDEMIGRLPEPTMPLSPRSRKVIDEPTHTGYEVVLDVYPDVIAGGILLLPKDLKEGERRPVVVCQHGLEGEPMDTITTDETTRAWQAYKGFATQLVKRGFVVYAPQNPYKGGDRFRTLQRKSNPLGRSLFSYITRQHERTLEWLAAQPFVDADRIGFYGLSYGGKTAMRVPALLPPRTLEDGTKKPGYSLSICSADFNEWIRKCVSNTDRYSYVFTGEYEMFEWNMGHVANYAELAMLISPRPFMVERGHDDGVAPDEWVAWEYAKVRRHYVKLGIPERTEIEWFDGPHTINGNGTFAFLHRHLDWPEPE